MSAARSPPSFTKVAACKHDRVRQMHAGCQFASMVHPRIRSKPFLRVQLHVHSERKPFGTALCNGLQLCKVGNQSSDVVLDRSSTQSGIVPELGRLIDAVPVLIHVPLRRQQDCTTHCAIRFEESECILFCTIRDRSFHPHIAYRLSSVLALFGPCAGVAFGMDAVSLPCSGVIP